jgi:hypothetical protein
MLNAQSARSSPQLLSKADDGTMMLDLQMGAANHQRIGQIMMVLQSTIRQIDSLD